MRDVTSFNLVKNACMTISRLSPKRDELEARPCSATRLL